MSTEWRTVCRTLCGTGPSSPLAGAGTESPGAVSRETGTRASPAQVGGPTHQRSSGGPGGVSVSVGCVRRSKQDIYHSM